MTLLTDVQKAIETEDASAYEMARSLGQDAVKGLDNGRWTLAALADLLPKNYGRDVIGTFAKDIGLRAASLREYRRVWRAARNVAGETFLSDYEALTYSHWREIVRHPDVETAREFLEQCVNDGWSSDQASLKRKEWSGKGVAWEKLADFETEFYRISGECIEISHQGLAALFRDRNRAKVLRFVIYEANELEETPE